MGKFLRDNALVIIAFIIAFIIAACIIADTVYHIASGGK